MADDYFEPEISPEAGSAELNFDDTEGAGDLGLIENDPGESLDLEGANEVTFDEESWQRNFVGFGSDDDGEVFAPAPSYEADDSDWVDDFLGFKEVGTVDAVPSQEEPLFSPSEDVFGDPNDDGLGGFDGSETVPGLEAMAPNSSPEYDTTGIERPLDAGGGRTEPARLGELGETSAGPSEGMVQLYPNSDDPIGGGGGGSAREVGAGPNDEAATEGDPRAVGYLPDGTPIYTPETVGDGKAGPKGFSYDDGSLANIIYVGPGGQLPPELLKKPEKATAETSPPPPPPAPASSSSDEFMQDMPRRNGAPAPAPPPPKAEPAPKAVAPAGWLHGENTRITERFAKAHENTIQYYQKRLAKGESREALEPLFLKRLEQLERDETDARRAAQQRSGNVFWKAEQMGEYAKAQAEARVPLQGRASGSVRAARQQVAAQAKQRLVAAGFSEDEIHKGAADYDRLQAFEKDQAPRRLSDGTILVDAKLSGDAEKWSAAVRGVKGASKEEQEAAIAQRVGVHEQWAQDVYKTLQTRSAFFDRESKFAKFEREEFQPRDPKHYTAAEVVDAFHAKYGAWYDNILDQIGRGAEQGVAGLSKQLYGAYGALAGSQSAIEKAMIASQIEAEQGAYRENLGGATLLGDATNVLVESAPTMVVMGPGAGAVEGLVARNLISKAAGRGIMRGLNVLVASGQSLGNNFVDAYSRLKQEGLSDTDARMAALGPAALDAVISGGITYLIGSPGSRALSGAERAAEQAAARESIKKAVLERFQGMGENFAQAFTDQYLQGLVAQATYDPTRTAEENFKNALNAGKVSVVLGEALRKAAESHAQTQRWNAWRKVIGESPLLDTPQTGEMFRPPEARRASPFPETGPRSEAPPLTHPEPPPGSQERFPAPRASGEPLPLRYRENRAGGPPRAPQTDEELAFEPDYALQGRTEPGGERQAAEAARAAAAGRVADRVQPLDYIKPSDDKPRMVTARLRSPDGPRSDIIVFDDNTHMTGENLAKELDGGSMMPSEAQRGQTLGGNFEEGPGGESLPAEQEGPLAEADRAAKQLSRPGEPVHGVKSTPESRFAAEDLLKTARHHDTVYDRNGAPMMVERGVDPQTGQDTIRFVMPEGTVVGGTTTKSANGHWTFDADQTNILERGKLVRNGAGGTLPNQNRSGEVRDDDHGANGHSQNRDIAAGPSQPARSETGTSSAPAPLAPTPAAPAASGRTRKGAGSGKPKPGVGEVPASTVDELAEYLRPDPTEAGPPTTGAPRAGADGARLSQTSEPSAVPNSNTETEPQSGANGYGRNPAPFTPESRRALRDSNAWVKSLPTPQKEAVTAYLESLPPKSRKAGRDLLAMQYAIAQSSGLDLRTVINRWDQEVRAGYAEQKGLPDAKFDNDALRESLKNQVKADEAAEADARRQKRYAEEPLTFSKPDKMPPKKQTTVENLARNFTPEARTQQRWAAIDLSPEEQAAYGKAMGVPAAGKVLVSETALNRSGRSTAGPKLEAGDIAALSDILHGPGVDAPVGYRGDQTPSGFQNPEVTHVGSVRYANDGFYYVEHLRQGSDLVITEVRKLDGSALPGEGGRPATRVELADQAKSRLWDIGLQHPDWHTYLRRIMGDPPPGMPEPHAHHILFKDGFGPEQQALVAEGQAILRSVGIDPIFGPENLIWAPNIEGQHIEANLREVVDGLRALKERSNSREDFVDKLRALGKIAAQRK